MQIVINIPEEIYQKIKRANLICGRRNNERFDYILFDAVSAGIPLPEHHGRLIDADALEKKMCDREEELGDDQALWESSAVSVALDAFAPTIIEADEEDVK